MHLILWISILYFSSPVFSFEGKRFFLINLRGIFVGLSNCFNLSVALNTFQIVCNLISDTFLPIVSYWGDIKEVKDQIKQQLKNPFEKNTFAKKEIAI